jgi:hypothetical protein
MARHGVLAALARDAGLAAGAMAWDGRIAHAGLAQDAGLPRAPLPIHAEAN